LAQVRSGPTTACTQFRTWGIILNGLNGHVAKGIAAGAVLVDPIELPVQMRSPGASRKYD
jgi:hypothetical protein